MAVLNIRDSGAAGDGQTNDAAAIQRAIDTCCKMGGGRVVVPAGGTFLAGSFQLKSNVDLHLEAGAHLRSSSQKEDFALNKEFGRRMWIWAEEAENIALTGLGTIDGNCLAFATEKLPHIYRALNWRPAMTFFVGCTNLRVSNLTLRDAAFWALHFAGCEDIVVHGVTIKNNLAFPNCDGIDPDHCRNVRISDCHIEAGDDCIVLKTTRPFARFGPTENVTVTGCTLVSRSAALKIGTESAQDIRNVVFDSCIITGSHRGLAIQLRDEGNVEHVIASNLVIETCHFEPSWWGAAEPIYITACHRHNDSPLGQIRHVNVHHISCQSENGIHISGSKDSIISNLRLQDIDLRFCQSTQWPGRYQDYRPSAGDGIVERDPPAIYCRDTSHTSLQNIRADWSTPQRPCLLRTIEMVNNTETRLSNISGLQVESSNDQTPLNP